MLNKHGLDDQQDKTLPPDVKLRKDNKNKTKKKLQLRKSYSRTEVKCDICNKDIKKGNVRYHNDEFDIDLCLKCSKKHFTLEEIKKSRQRFINEENNNKLSLGNNLVKQVINEDILYKF